MQGGMLGGGQENRIEDKLSKYNVKVKHDIDQWSDQGEDRIGNKYKGELLRLWRYLDSLT